MFNKKIKKEELTPYLDNIYAYMESRCERSKCTKGEKEALTHIKGEFTELYKHFKLK